MTRSPWSEAFERRPDEYVLGTAPSPLALDAVSRLGAGARVLDLGCGEGRDTVFFAECGLDATGVDVSPAGVEKARRLARDRGVDARFVCADLGRAILPGPFELVYSCGALHYVERHRRGRMLDRLKAATAVGGFHAHLVFTDRDVYVEGGEIVDYFGAGELDRAFSNWAVIEADHGTIACEQDGTAHRHGVGTIVAQSLAPAS